MLFLEVIRTGDNIQKAKNNLEFLVDANLINDEPRRDKIRNYLASAKPISHATRYNATRTDRSGSRSYLCNAAGNRPRGYCL